MRLDSTRDGLMFRDQIQPLEYFSVRVTLDYEMSKTLNLRIFPDDNGKMNFSCLEVKGEILVVSQFTLAGDCSRGRRPGFDRAADPNTARTLYEYYVELLSRSGLKIGKGRFAADMQVKLVNDGPVTFLLER